MRNSSPNIRHQTSNIRHSPAFTLVELLVVISIIALLMAMLLPALGRAREAGNRTVCLNNQRQTFFAIAAYTTDNKDWLPVMHPGSWFYTVLGPGATAISNGVTFTPNFGLLYPSYQPRKRTWLCPSFVANAKSLNGNIIPWFPNGSWWPSNYAWLEAADDNGPTGGNTSYCYLSRTTVLSLAWDPNSGVYGQTSLRSGQSWMAQLVGDLQNTSNVASRKTLEKTPILYDVNYDNGYLFGVYFQSQHWSNQNEGGNVTYGDGHGAWLRWSGWVDSLAYPGDPGRNLFLPPYL